MPPVIIKVRDHRTFGRKPVVGRHVITAILFEDAPKIDAHAEIQGDFNTNAVVIPILFFFFYNNDYRQSKNKLKRHTAEPRPQYSV